MPSHFCFVYSLPLSVFWWITPLLPLSSNLENSWSVSHSARPSPPLLRTRLFSFSFLFSEICSREFTTKISQPFKFFCGKGDIAGGRVAVVLKWQLNSFPGFLLIWKQEGKYSNSWFAYVECCHLWRPITFERHVQFLFCFNILVEETFLYITVYFQPKIQFPYEVTAVYVGCGARLQ